MTLRFHEQDRIAAIWSRARVVSRPDVDVAEHDYVRMLREAYGTGSVTCVRLDLEIDPSIWTLLIHSENWKYAKLMQHILPPLAAALKADGTRAADAADAFEPVSTFSLAGILGAKLSSGGAYTPLNRWPFSRSMALATSFVDEFAQARGVEQLLLLERSWCGYFFDVAWDLTVLGISAREGAICALCATDTD
jgi:hypothetical protein